MDLVLRKFVYYYTGLFDDYGEKFLEDDGRRIFLLFVRPIINGRGNYYIEGRTVSFNFNKKKQTGIQEIVLGDKILVEAVV